MTTSFTLTHIYKELALKLLKWRHRKQELIEFLENLRNQDLLITPLRDQDRDGQRFLLNGIDPLTFFGVFNRKIRQNHRIGILKAMKENCVADQHDPGPELQSL